MIHLVSLNPALDYYFKVREPVRGKIGEALDFRVDAGGKALNVSRFAREWKMPHAVWLGTGGGSDPSHILFRSLLEREGLKARFLGGRSPVRSNLVLEKDGSSSKYNHEGSGGGPGWARALSKAARPGDLLVLTGSVPEGPSVRGLAALIRSCRKSGLGTLVDSSGAALASALKSRPWFFKVNLFEISGALGWKIGDLDQALALIPGVFRGMGLSHGALTDGRHGAVLWQDGETVRVEPPKSRTSRLVVGAGDAFLAGYLRGLRMGMDLEDRARLAASAGSVVAGRGIRGFDAALAERGSRKVRSWRIT